jgi:hypothetical protein
LLLSQIVIVLPPLFKVKLKVPGNRDSLYLFLSTLIAKMVGAFVARPPKLNPCVEEETAGPYIKVLY